MESVSPGPVVNGMERRVDEIIDGDTTLVTTAVGRTDCRHHPFHGHFEPYRASAARNHRDSVIFDRSIGSAEPCGRAVRGREETSELSRFVTRASTCAVTRGN